MTTEDRKLCGSQMAFEDCRHGGQIDLTDVMRPTCACRRPDGEGCQYADWGELEHTILWRRMDAAAKRLGIDKVHGSFRLKAFQVKDGFWSVEFQEV
jgi:hypothetical protein